MENFEKDISLINAIAAVPSILDVVCRTTGMGFAAVARVTESRWIACTVKDDIGFGLKPGGELKLETTICDEIRQMREPVAIDHVDQDDTYREHNTPRMYGFQSYISMPIFLPDGSMFGTLCAIDPKPAKVKTPEVMGMFRLFAELIAFHIDAIERLAASESRLLAEKETSELREQFIAVLGHDLRSPLTAVSMGAAVLKQNDGLNPGSTMIADMIHSSAEKMSGLIDDVMDFTRGRLGGGITLERNIATPIEPILRQAIAEMRSISIERDIEAEIDIRENVFCDGRRISQMFTNLLGNAVSHGKADRPIKVSVIAKDGKFELSVANAADPIPSTILDRLFHPFSRGEANQHQQGLGLGLYIASQIAKAHGGVLEASSDENETRFTFRMASGAQ